HVQIGLLPGLTALPMNRVIGYELELLGSHGMAAHAYPEMLRLIERGAVDPARLVGRRVSLDESVDALVEMGSFKGVGVTVVDRFR
ncbi:MAG TPA: hypothetical protein VFP65_24635, partial [Anaeromyxobacteraceae bacterium]|nr:hypothetical protein [Anaeromyxobacteraceae bacterium]